MILIFIKINTTRAKGLPILDEVIDSTDISDCNKLKFNKKI